MDMKPCEYRCPTCGRLDPFNQTIEDALRATIADKQEAIVDNDKVYRKQCKEIEGLLAEVASLKAATGWRSMESAPKDGEHLLLFMPSIIVPDMAVGRYWPNGALWLTVEVEDEVYPTHWMPLPAAPESNDA